MMTSRKRFLATMDFKQPDIPWVRAFAFIWPETCIQWRKQGYEGPELGWHGEGLSERFDLDVLARVDPWYGPVPAFEYEVIEEDETTRLYVNHEGILMREFREHADTSMPQFVRFPVENPDDFETFAAERLALNADARFPADWKKQVAAGGLKGVAGGANIADASDTTDRADENPRLCWADRWGGFFGSLRNMLGLENLCCAFYDNPAWVERMMEERADAIIQITSKVFEHTTFDLFWYWEDMAYNHASLIDPKMYRKFASKHYRRVNDWLRSKGVRHIGLDSDGDIRGLISVWLDSGIDMLWPFEVQSNMDVVAVRKQYGHDLIIMGGIDKRKLAVGGETMRKEVDRVMPLVEDGGYFPEADHSIPPDVTWPGFIDYVEYLKTRLGRG
jgi:uroporphyrinogen decarboxylase